MDECTVRECFNRVSEKMTIQDEYALLIRYVSQSRNLILGVPGWLTSACISLSDLVVENSKSCEIPKTLRREVKTYTFGIRAGKERDDEDHRGNGEGPYQIGRHQITL